MAGGPTREHLGAMCMTSPPVGESSALGKQRRCPLARFDTSPQRWAGVAFDHEATESAYRV
jgi:hypothetical protein